MNSALYNSDEDAILEEMYSSEDWEVEIQVARKRHFNF